MTKITLRTLEMMQRYADDIANGRTRPISEETPVREFPLWKIVENRYPYAEAKTCHLLLPKRKVATQFNLTRQEHLELIAIKEVLMKEGHYDYMKENMPSMISVPDHYHIHLIETWSQEELGVVSITQLGQIEVPNA